MAIPNLDLIGALRRTADKMAKGAAYQWGHMGACNCGNLAQEITKRSKAEIHQYALSSRMGDWADQVAEFCPTSGLPLDLIISDMLAAGLNRDDLKHLERLSDQLILRALPIEQRHLAHNRRDDVVLYLRTWANLLEEQLLNEVQLPDFELKVTV